MGIGGGGGGGGLPTPQEIELYSRVCLLKRENDQLTLYTVENGLKNALSPSLF